MIESTFNHISVGKDGSVWAAGEKGILFRLYGDAGLLGWSPLTAGRAERIAVFDFGTAWLTNQVGEIWKLENAENMESGGTLTQVPDYGNAQEARAISVGVDGSVWYARSTDGNLFRREGDRWARHACTAADVAAINKDDAWVVSTEGEILRLWNGEWVKVPTSSGDADAQRISAGSDGSVWYVDTNGAVYFWLMMANGWSPAWDQSEMGPAYVIAVHTQAEVWCLSMAGQVWRTFNTSPHDNRWHQVVEIGPDTTGHTPWTYTVQSGDSLWAIVRNQYNLADSTDTSQISQLVDSIVDANSAKIPHLTRSMIRPGDVLTLPG